MEAQKKKKKTSLNRLVLVIRDKRVEVVISVTNTSLLNVLDDKHGSRLWTEYI